MQHSHGQPVRSHLDRYNHGPRGRPGSTRRSLRIVFRDRDEETPWVRTPAAPGKTPGVRADRHRTRSLDDMNVLRDCGERAGLSDIDSSRQDGDPKPELLATGGSTLPTAKSVPSILESESDLCRAIHCMRT